MKTHLLEKGSWKYRLAYWYADRVPPEIDRGEMLEVKSFLLWFRIVWGVTGAVIFVALEIVLGLIHTILYIVFWPIRYILIRAWSGRKIEFFGTHNG